MTEIDVFVEFNFDAPKLFGLCKAASSLCKMPIDISVRQNLHAGHLQRCLYVCMSRSPMPSTYLCPTQVCSQHNFMFSHSFHQLQYQRCVTLCTGCCPPNITHGRHRAASMANMSLLMIEPLH